MTNDPIRSAGAGLPGTPQGVQSEGIGAGVRRSEGAEAEPSGPAFEALLEKLEARAEDLKRSTEDVAGPTELSGAVDRARASLDDALSLGDKLLEAYRQAAQSRKESAE